MKKIKLIVYIILTVICGITIFMFSSEDKSASTDTSLKVLTVITEFISEVLHIQISNTRSLHTFVRKMAHFSIYTILSVFSYNTFRLLITQKVKAVIVSFVFCVLIAISDEIHQFFVPGRSAELFDIFIDTLGICFGLCLVFLFNLIIIKIKRR